MIEDTMPTFDLGMLQAPPGSAVTVEIVRHIWDDDREKARVYMFVYEPIGGDIVRCHPRAQRKGFICHRMKPGSPLFLSSYVEAYGVGGSLHRLQQSRLQRKSTAE